MKPIRWDTPEPQALAAFLEGELAAPKAAAVQRRLAESSDARRQLEQLRGIRAALSSFDHEFDDVDLLPSIRAQIREQARVRARPARPLEGWIERFLRRPAGLVFATGALTVAACLGFAFATRHHSTDEVRAKAGREATDPARWAGVQAYRVRAGKPEHLGETLAPGDGLLFSYTNLGQAPLSHLMIFGVDARGEVHWFHPAYEREGSNPGSIAIAEGAAEAPLAELVQDDFPAGPLTIHALFSNRPVQVLEVEDWLKREPKTNWGERIPGSVDQVLSTRIEP